MQLFGRWHSFFLLISVPFNKKESVMENQEALCPVLPDVPCPRGEQAAKECLDRLKGDFDPMADLNDFMILNCAVMQAQEIRTHTPHV